MSNEKEIENANNQNGVSTEISALDVAKYLIGLAQFEYKEGIDNLRLQKLLYYAQGVYYSMYNKFLFNDEIEAWKYGPVIRSIYIFYCENNDKPISITFDEYKQVCNKLSNAYKEYLNNFYKTYRVFPTSILIEATHRGMPWIKTYKENEKNVIDKNDIAEYFKKISNGSK